MIRQLTKCIREYKAPTVWTLVLILAEVAIDVIIPFETANLINEVKAGAELGGIVRVGLVLVLLAMISLVCGGAAGFTGSKAASGFAKNVRHDLFTKVQGFSFENIDKFSSASLVTRMTTDIQNVQMAYMMCIRIAVRAPLMMIFSIIMAFIMGGRLALTFVVIVPVLVVGLFFIAREAMPAFRAVFRKYDKLNESVEENVRAMRVVKGFARESYETKKFTAASDNIRGDFTHAERVVALNSPLMQLCVYFNMVFVLFVGSKLIITNGGTTIDVGQLSAMLTYGIQVLMSLMMVSMIYVMLTMSAESVKHHPRGTRRRARGACPIAGADRQRRGADKGLGVTEMRDDPDTKRGRTYLAGVEELGVTCLGCFWHRAFFRWEDDGRPVEMFSDLASQALEAKCVRIAQLAAAVWCAVNAALLFFRAWLDLDAARGFDELYADLIAAGAPSIAEAWAPRIAMYAAFGLLWLGLTVWGVRGGAHAPEMARAQRRTARSRIDPPGKETTMNDVKKTWCGPVYTLDPEKNGAAVQPPLRRGLAARGHGLAFLPLSSWSAE